MWEWRENTRAPYYSQIMKKQKQNTQNDKHQKRHAPQ